MTDNKYWASETAENLGRELNAKVKEYDDNLLASGIFTRMNKAYRMYYGYGMDRAHSASEIGITGDSAEFINIKVNDMRNIIQHLVVITTGQRPVIDARAVNSDYKAQVSAVLGQKIVDYYFREKDVESFLRDAVEMSCVLGEAYVGTFWDANSGKETAVDPETGRIFYDGDIDTQLFTPFNVIRDCRKTDPRKHDWFCVRRFTNKYDLAATYPEKADVIMNVDPTGDNLTEKYKLMPFQNYSSDDIPVYEFFHRKTPALPKGRTMLFLSGGEYLRDGELPYRSMTIRRISPANIMDTAFGYAPSFDMMGMQEMSDGLYSSIATNLSTFAVQNIWMQEGMDINYSALADGLSIIESAQKPEPLQLTASPPEAYQFIQMLDNKMQQMGGIDDVTRGQVPEGVKSGSALAMMASTAIQFSAGLQQSYAKLVEDVGTDIIHHLQDFATTKRAVTIVGQHNRSYLKEFSSEDISGVARIVADLGNPLSRTITGRLQLADGLAEKGFVTSPQQYIGVLKTGQIDNMTEGSMSKTMNVKMENEAMSDNQDVIAIATDNHPMHIDEHNNVLADPEVRKNPQLTQRVLNHIMEHLNLMKATDPVLLSMVGVQPLPPPPMPGQGNAAAPMNPEATPVNEQAPGMPQMPKNPMTGEQAPMPSPV